MRFITRLHQHYIVSHEKDLEHIDIKKILTFPDSRQATNFSCGAASVQAVLYYYGIEVREDKLIKIFDAKPTHIVHSGIDPDTLKQKMEQLWGLKVQMGEMTIEDVKDFIDKDIPVILAIQAWRGEDNASDETDYTGEYKDGHYVVAIGYTDHSMIFDDPSIPSNRAYLPFDELDTRWHDNDYHGNVYEHLGLAVHGKQPTFNPKTIKKIL